MITNKFILQKEIILKKPQALLQMVTLYETDTMKCCSLHTFPIHSTGHWLDLNKSNMKIVSIS